MAIVHTPGRTHSVTPQTTFPIMFRSGHLEAPPPPNPAFTSTVATMPKNAMGCRRCIWNDPRPVIAERKKNSQSGTYFSPKVYFGGKKKLLYTTLLGVKQLPQFFIYISWELGLHAARCEMGRRDKDLAKKVRKRWNLRFGNLEEKAAGGCSCGR